MKALKNFRFVSKQINPSKFAEIIDKTHIISVSPNRRGCWTPYIGEHEFMGIA
jgi:hypothetical protein